MTLTASTLRELVDQGKTTAQIADLYDLPDSTVRGRANRAGIKLSRSRAPDIRSIAEEMEPLDAVEYLIGVVEQLQAITGVETAQETWGFHLTKTERRILSSLVSASPRTLNRETIFNAMYYDVADADDLPEIKIVAVLICRIRKKMPANVGHIHNVWGQGYRFEPAEGAQC